MDKLNRELFIERYLNLFNGKNILDISAGTGLNPQVLNSIQKQKTFPSLSTLYLLKEYFGCSLDYLLGISDIKHSPITYSDMFQLLEILYDHDALRWFSGSENRYNLEGWALNPNIATFINQYNFLTSRKLGQPAIEEWKKQNFDEIFSSYGFTDLKALDKKDVVSLVSENIDCLIRESGIKISHLEDITGITQTQISNFRHGKNIPDVETLYKLSGPLNCKMDDFVASSRMIYDTFISRMCFLCRTFSYNNEENSFFDSVISAFLDNYRRVRLDFILYNDLVENWSKRVLKDFPYPVHDKQAVNAMKSMAVEAAETNSHNYQEQDLDDSHRFTLLDLKNALEDYINNPATKEMEEALTKDDINSTNS